MSVSAVVLTGAFTFALIKFKASLGAAAPVVFLFGFFVADTGAAPVVRQLIGDLLHAANSLG
nr:hypothetical protein [Wenjunlia tyrosinilytica]